MIACMLACLRVCVCVFVFLSIFAFAGLLSIFAIFVHQVLVTVFCCYILTPSITGREKAGQG